MITTPRILRQKIGNFAGNIPNFFIRLIRMDEIELYKLIESCSLRQMIRSFMAAILIFSILFYVLSIINEGIASSACNVPPKIGFLDCLYFSIVTVSTVGYGDYHPEGFGRFLAEIEVLTGLVIISLIIAKIASDRTATYVKLLYSSDSERRLKEFVSDIESNARKLRASRLAYDHKTKFSEIKSLELIMANLKKYYLYQAKYGALSEYWARKNSFKIVKASSLAAEQLGLIGKSAFTNAEERKRVDDVFMHLKGAVRIIAQEQSGDDIDKVVEHIDAVWTLYNKVKETGKYSRDGSDKVTPFIESEVRRLIPPAPWPKDLNKEIADELRISRRLARKALLQIAEIE